MKYLESLLDIGFCTRVKVIFYVLLRKHPFKMSSIRNVFKCLFSVHEGKNLLVRKKGMITYSLFYLSKAYTVLPIGAWSHSLALSLTMS